MIIYGTYTYSSPKLLTGMGRAQEILKMIILLDIYFSKSHFLDVVAEPQWGCMDRR